MGCGWISGLLGLGGFVNQHRPGARSGGEVLWRNAKAAKWVIGWAEDDDAAGAHCCTCWDLQLWAERMFANSAEASHYGCEGMMAIHWRTAAISPNITALTQAGWGFDTAGGANVSPSAVGSKMPAWMLFGQIGDVVFLAGIPAPRLAELCKSSTAAIWGLMR